MHTTNTINENRDSHQDSPDERMPNKTRARHLSKLLRFNNNITYSGFTCKNDNEVASFKNDNVSEEVKMRRRFQIIHLNTQCISCTSCFKDTLYVT